MSDSQETDAFTEYIEDLCKLEGIYVSLIGLNGGFTLLLVLSLVVIEPGTDSFYVVILGLTVTGIGILLGGVCLFICRRTTIGRHDDVP